MDYKNISIDNLFMQKGHKILFNNTKLILNNGNKYALIGSNGIGKSSLADAIFNKEYPNISEYLDILYIHQEAMPSDTSVIREVLTCNVEREKLLYTNTKLLDKLSNDTEIDLQLLERVRQNQEQLNSIDYERDESEVKKILSGLGFNDREQQLPVKEFSGGWRMRISLAKALYLKPTLLILDEPTNHLDLEAVIWLTEYLSKWRKTLLFISHNINFINEVCSHVIHCEDQQLHYYKGGYYQFKKNYDIQYKKSLQSYEQYEKKIKALKKNSKNTKKDIQSYIKKNEVTRPSYTRPIKLEFQERYTASHTTVLELQNIDFAYNEPTVIFKNLDLRMNKGDRIAFVGRNGVGKSTLFKLICGKIKPNKGNILGSDKIKIGYFVQHFEEVLPMNMNSIDYLKSLDSNISNEEIRKYLGSFQIPGKCHAMNISNLSGGQKARIVFISLILQKLDILLLDEPTNHLDIETIQWLIQAINNYNGTVIVISHDEELITSIEADIHILNNQNILKFNGEYEDYREQILSEEL